MGINKMNNFMLISNLLMPHCNKTFRRHPYQIVIGQGREKYFTCQARVCTPPNTELFRGSGFRNIPEIFSVKKRKRGRRVGSNLRSLLVMAKLRYFTSEPFRFLPFALKKKTKVRFFSFFSIRNHYRTCSLRFDIVNFKK